MELNETVLWLASTADVASADGKIGLHGVASRALADYQRLRRIERNVAEAGTRFYANRTDDYVTGWRDALHYVQHGELPDRDGA